MTYNIWGASGYENSKEAQENMDSIATVIKLEDPDFVCLQEVDSSTNRSGKDVFQARDIAKRLNYGYTYVIADTFSTGGFGDAVLYKKKYTNVSKLEFHMDPVDPGQGGEHRSVCMIKVRLDSLNTDLYIASTHLDHRADESSRILQANKLREIVNSINGDLILAGDFNAVPSSETINIIKGFMNTAYISETQYTYPALEDNPTSMIDYIMYKPLDNFTVKNYMVDLSAHASDHYPVVSILRVKK
jgi:endonuclease/exonuclease/phosphatase family metal-dependent hydrolase